MAQFYPWDSVAQAQIELKELDDHFQGERAHYSDIAKKLFKILRDNHANPDRLKKGDLYELLYDALTRDGTLIGAMTHQDRGLPRPEGRGGAKWYSWFTSYVIDECWDECVTQ